MELAITEEHMSCVTGMDQRLRLWLHCQSDTFLTAVKFKTTVFVSIRIVSFLAFSDDLSYLYS